MGTSIEIVWEISYQSNNISIIFSITDMFLNEARVLKLDAILIHAGCVMTEE